jgi:hypothetical protein
MMSRTTKTAEFTDEHQAKILADEMREAIAKNSRKDAKKVMERVASSTPQVHGFFIQSFSKEENLNIRLLRDCGLTKGTRVEYVGQGIEQYAGEVLTVESINIRGELACLRPDGRGYTTWLKSGDLHLLGLHPEAIAFFDLKSQNKNCFQLRARNFPPITQTPGSELQRLDSCVFISKSFRKLFILSSDPRPFLLWGEVKTFSDARLLLSFRNARVWFEHKEDPE